MSLFEKFEDKSRLLKGLLEQSPRDPFSVSMDEMLGPTRAMVKGKEIVLAGTNNYLGLTYDEGAIEAALDEIIAANPAQVEKAKENPKLKGWFVGQVMKATGGKANPKAVNEIVTAKLGL